MTTLKPPSQDRTAKLTCRVNDQVRDTLRETYYLHGALDRIQAQLITKLYNHVKSEGIQPTEDPVRDERHLQRILNRVAFSRTYRTATGRHVTR